MSLSTEGPRPFIIENNYTDHLRRTKNGQEPEKALVYPLNFSEMNDIERWFNEDAMVQVCSKQLLGKVVDGGGHIMFKLQGETSEDQQEQYRIKQHENEALAEVPMKENGRNAHSIEDTLANLHQNVQQYSRSSKKQQQQQERDQMVYALDQTITNDIFNVLPDVLENHLKYGFTPFRINRAALLRQYPRNSSVSYMKMEEEEQESNAVSPTGMDTEEDPRAGFQSERKRVRRDRRQSRDPIITVPKHGTGVFGYRFVGKEAPEMEVVFIELNQTERFRVGVNMTYSLASISPDVYVYVWPGKMPSIDGMQLRSDMYPAFKRYLEFWTRLRNNMDADMVASHPPNYVSKRDELAHKKAEEMPTDALYANDQFDSEPTTEDRQVYKRSELERQHIEDEKARLRETHSRPSKPDGVGTMALARGVDTTKIVYPEWIDSLIPLGNGRTVQKGSAPTTVTGDIEASRRAYEEVVCVCMGIQRNFLEGRVSVNAGGGGQGAGPGGQGGAAGSRQAGDAQNMDFTRNSIMQLRNHAESFVQQVYSMMFDEHDEDLIASMLINIKRHNAPLQNAQHMSGGRWRLGTRRGQAGSIHIPKNGEGRELAHAVARLNEVASYRDRISLNFNREPLPKTIDINVLRELHTMGLLSPHETQKLFRQLLNVNEIDDPQHPIPQFIKLQRELELQDVVMGLREREQTMKISKEQHGMAKQTHQKEMLQEPEKKKTVKK